MNNLFIFILIAVILLLGGALLWVLFSSRQSAPKEEIPQNVPMIRVRSAVPGKTVVEIYSDDLLLEGPVPYFSELEKEAEKEQTLIERWRRTDLSPEERLALAEEMRAVGYTVTLEGESSPSNPVSVQGKPAEPKDAELPSEPEKLFRIVEDKAYPEEVRKEARRRLTEYFSRQDSAPAEEGEEDDSHSGENGEEDGSEPAEGEFEVDPVTGAPVLRKTEQEGSEAPEEVREVDESYIVTFDFPHEDVNESEDDRDSRLAVELMKFVARSFRKGLIDPELVDFVQRRLNLQVNCDWSEEEKSRALAHRDSFHSLDDKSVEELDSFVHSVVEENAVMYAGKATKSGKSVNLGFDPHGGKNDLLWKRLEGLEAWAAEGQ